MLELKKLSKEVVLGKRVFLRADLDVPIKDGQIDDETRLLSWSESLDILLEASKEIIIAGHLGRPNGIEEKYTLLPVAKWLANKLSVDISDVTQGEFKAWRIGEKVNLLENLRFYEAEEENDPIFSEKLAKLADVYVNDSFSTSHRKHSSIVGIASLIPSFAGISLSREVESLSEVLDNPDRPLVVVIGGAKIETKLPLVEKMHHFADYVLVGGEIAEQDKILLKIQHEKKEGKISALLVADLTEDGLDITSKSAENFVQIINTARTVIWNGPMGMIEKEDSTGGTLMVAKGIIQSNAKSIVGGGDSLSFLNKERMIDKFSFVSMGGGAMLEFLSGETIPGIEVLKS